MPRTLEQYNIHCDKCGEYMWKYEESVYDIYLHKEVDVKRDDFCGKCDGRTFYAALKTAEKIVPLTENQRDDPRT